MAMLTIGSPLLPVTLVKAWREDNFLLLLEIRFVGPPGHNCMTFFAVALTPLRLMSSWPSLRATRVRVLSTAKTLYPRMSTVFANWYLGVAGEAEDREEVVEELFEEDLVREVRAISMTATVGMGLGATMCKWKDLSRIWRSGREGSVLRTSLLLISFFILTTETPSFRILKPRTPSTHFHMHAACCLSGHWILSLHLGLECQ